LYTGLLYSDVVIVIYSWHVFHTHTRALDTLVSSGRRTATLQTNVSRLLAQGCRTAFKLVLGKWTSAMNSLSSH